MSATTTVAGPSATDLYDFATALHGDLDGFLALFSGRRAADNRDLQEPQSAYFAYPDEIPAAAAWLRDQNGAGREGYIGTHLVRERRRRKESACPVNALWADVDHSRGGPDRLRATLTVESSPGRMQAYWRLSRPVEPAVAETLNKRLGVALGCDASGYDLTQLLRAPGTISFKYPERPIAEIVEHDPARVYDPDELDRLLPPLPVDPPRRRRPAAVTGEGSGDMPPVLLDAEGMATWRGERPKVKTDGSGQIDRSASLPKIGRALFDAGATRPTIERALAERDEALDWRKYTGRRDQGEQYAKVVDLLEREGRKPAATIAVGMRRAAGPEGGRIAELEAMVAELTAERDALRTDVAELKRTQSAIVATVTNPHLKAEAVTIVRLAADCVRRRSKGERPDENGFVKVSPAGLGEDYDDPLDGPALTPIRGKATVNRHLQNLANAGLIDRTFKDEPVRRVLRDSRGLPIRDESGQLVRAEPTTVKRTWVKVTGDSLADVLDPFARWRRPAPPPGQDPPKTHGGKRTKAEAPACPECGSDDTLIVAIACRSCGAKSDVPPSPEIATPAAFHDETVEDGPPPGVVEKAAFHLETRHRPAPGMAPRYEDDGTTVAAAFQRGQGLPGFDPPPPDRFTDVRIGGRE